MRLSIPTIFVSIAAALVATAATSLGVPHRRACTDTIGWLRLQADPQTANPADPVHGYVSATVNAHGENIFIFNTESRNAAVVQICASGSPQRIEFVVGALLPHCVYRTCD